MSIQKIRQLIKLLTELSNEDFEVKLSRDARGKNIQSINIRTESANTFRASVTEPLSEKITLIPKEEKIIYNIAPFTGTLSELEYFLIRTIK